MENTLALAGSAGRQADTSKVSRGLYDRMFEETCRVIAQWDIEHAVSGGAAFADHLAVRAFLEGKVRRLTLYLPARFVGRSYQHNPRFQSNPGKTSNDLHALFSKSCGIDSLGELAEAIRRGAEVHVHEGFQTRNIYVANAASHMLAFTFGTATSRDLTPEDPGFQNPAVAGLKITKGTAHCWSEAWKCRLKTHIDLNELMRAA
ncbi:hypothetical protein D3C71_277510 [compost metagenome]